MFEGKISVTCEVFFFFLDKPQVIPTSENLLATSPLPPPSPPMFASGFPPLGVESGYSTIPKASAPNSSKDVTFPVLFNIPLI